MEQFFFRKIELWVFLLAAILAMIGVVIVSWLALAHYRGQPDVGRFGSLAAKVAAFPDLIVDVATAKPAQETEESRFPHELGFTPPGGTTDSGFVLLSHFDEDSKRYVVDLVSLATQKVVRRYAPDIAAINGRSGLDPAWVNLARDKGPERYRMVHPLLMSDGGLIFQDDSPLVRIDACSNVVWTLDGVFHHSIERDREGNLWVPSRIWPSSIPGTTRNTVDEALAQVSPDGQLLMRRSMAQILVDNDMAWVVYGIPPFSEDPLHMNDIQPVLESGPYWQAGDLFVSLRNRSMVLLYRPSTNKILWYKQGPWILQHDINILNDHQISVFNNNTRTVAGDFVVDGSNNIAIYDFAKDAVTFPYSDAFSKLDIRTKTEGRGTILDNGDVFVEESDYGRALRVSVDGEIRWRYVSGLSDGSNSILGWSRYVPSSEAKALNDNDQSCGA